MKVGSLVQFAPKMHGTFPFLFTTFLLARRRKGIPMVDWEKWIDDDVRLLNESGVVRDWSKVDFAQFSGSDEEMQSWKRYLRNRNSQMIVGRGLLRSTTRPLPSCNGQSRKAKI